jgi:5,10-methylenetetrahydromethanopterin reductase
MDMGLLMFPNPVATVPMAQMVEKLGFDSFVFADTQCLTPEVWSHLMLVATATERMEIGTGVTNPVSRDPAVTASAALGVQHASGGRVVVGIGRGDSSMAKIGRKPAPPAVLERYIEQLRAYLDGKEVDRDGTPSRIEWLDDCEVARVPIEVAATGPKVIDLAARHADRICFAVGADTERIEECMARARRAAEAADRDPASPRFGAFINCLINDDRHVAREAIRGSLSVFAHFSGFQGMDIASLPEGVRAAAGHLRTAYDMKNHAVSAGAHAQALDAEFIHRFGIAGPLDEAMTRLREIRDTGVDFLRIIPGSRDMPPGIGAESIQGLAKARAALEAEASA